MNNYFTNLYNLHEHRVNEGIVEEGIFGNLGINKGINVSIWAEFLSKSRKKLEEYARADRAGDYNLSTYISAVGNSQEYYLPYVLAKSIIPGEEDLKAHEDDIVKYITSVSRCCSYFIISPETIEEDPWDFKKSVINFVAPGRNGYAFTPPVLCICGFKNLRTLEGFIDLDSASIVVWDCPRIKNLKGVKIKNPRDIAFFPDAVEGKTLGKPKSSTKLEIFRDLHASPRVVMTAYTVQGDSKQAIHDQITKAMDRSKMKNQFDDNKPKTVTKAAPVISNPAKSADELPLLYRNANGEGNYLYGDPDFKKLVARISRNNISVYKYSSNGNVQPNIWMTYNDNDKILYTKKGVAAYRVV